jgi:transcriptional regulator with GAF, ATPase, and Fis domain
MNLSEDILNSYKIACRTESTLLITGPTGTGKSSLARKIHENSKRRGKPFVVINLATLSEGTLESELFGHERGAFTGADLKRIGRLEMAHGGTVFLDEVGELRPGLQARLLEFLQNKLISPVGSNREIKLDVRIIAATHHDLASSVRKREFREDLFHRLRVITVGLRPLCDRLNELPLLIDRFLREFCEREKRTPLRLSTEVFELFSTHSWPGNVRELKNVLEYSVFASEGSLINLDHLPHWFVQDCTQSHACSASPPTSRPKDDSFSPAPLGIVELPLTLDYSFTLLAFEKEYLRRAIFINGGRINRTARQLGLHKSTLTRKIRKFGIANEPWFAFETKKNLPETPIWTEN